MSSYPWFPFYTSDWFGGTRSLRPAVRGIYIDLLAAMWEAGGPIPENYDHLSDKLCARPSDINKAVDDLVRRGKLTRDHGLIFNDRVASELSQRQAKSDAAKASAERRWAKKSKAQQGSDANALRSDSEGNASHSQSHSHSTTGQELDSPVSGEQEQDGPFRNVMPFRSGGRSDA